MVAENGAEPTEECKKTHLNTSHRLSGVQAHTCDPTDRPRGERWHAAGRYSCTVAGSVTFFSLNDSPGISALVSPCRIFW